MSNNTVLAKMAVLISANTAEFNSKLAQTHNHLTKFTAGVRGMAATMGVTFGAYQIYQGLAYGASVVMDFEKRMSEVLAITQATGKEFQDLRNDALQLGRTTKFTASEVSELQVAYGRLGFTTKEILNATEATLDLAAATGEDLAKSADVAGSTLRGFEMNAAEMNRVVDVMAESFNKSALGLDNFAESMKYVAPVANATGATVEETTAMLGVLADAGIRGSMAGTSLRKIFTDMTKDGRPLQERLAELAKKGITLSDSMDEVGRTAQTSLLILTNNTDKINNLTAALNDSAGAASETARIMEDNLTNDVTKLTSAWDGLLLEIGETDPWRRAVQGLTSIVNALAGVPDLEGGLRVFTEWIKDGANDNILNRHIENLKEIRRELGKPIDTSVVQQLAEKYKLTDAQANFLYSSILEVNKALSFQERAIEQFKQFAERNGFTDLNKGAEAYKQELYELILAEQTQLYQLEKYTPELTKDIEERKNQIATYRRVITVLNEYVATAEKVAKVETKIGFPGWQKPAATPPPKAEPGTWEPDTNPKFDVNDGMYDVLMKEAEAVFGLKTEYEELNDVLLRQHEYQQKIQKEEELRIEKLYAQADAIVSIGQTIGSAFTEAAMGQQSFLDAVKQVTGQIIELYLRQAIAAMIAASIKDPSTPLPLAKLAMAGAGIAGVKALFNQHTGGGATGAYGNMAAQTGRYNPTLKKEPVVVHVTGRLTTEAGRIQAELDSYNEQRKRHGA